MELRFVVLFEGQARLEAVVTAEGKIRRITIRWYEKGNTSVPPVNWLEQVRAEVEHRISQERLGRSNILF